MIVKLLIEHHLEVLSLKGGCTGLSESTLVKIPHCWKSHVAAHNWCPIKLQSNWSVWFSGPKRTGVMIEFSELAYHFRSPGDLEVEELDDVLQFLHTRVQKQEKTELSQLSRLYQALKRYCLSENKMGQYAIFRNFSHWQIGKAQAAHMHRLA